MDKERIAGTVTQVGAATSVLGGLSLSEWGVIIGIWLGVVGFLASQYWQWKNYNLRKQTMFRSNFKAEDDQ